MNINLTLIAFAADIPVKPRDEHISDGKQPSRDEQDRQNGTFGREHRSPSEKRYRRHEFDAMTLDELTRITGVAPPVSGEENAIAEFRDRAWESWQVDYKNRHEYGTARQGKVDPED